MQQEVLTALSSRPDGGWQLLPAAAARLGPRLAGLARTAEDPARDLRPVLKLIVVLRDDPRSRDAAQTLVRLLRETPETYRALAQARVSADGQSRRLRSMLSRFEDRTPTRNAPRHDSPAPDGTVSARQFLRPLDAAARKAQRDGNGRSRQQQGT